MNYKCRCCGAVEYAENLEEITNRQGYCIICNTLGEEARAEVKRNINREKQINESKETKKKYAEEHYNEPVDLTRKKVVKKKDKNANKVKVFKCLDDDCGEYYLYSSWDKKCDKCGNRVQYVGKMTYKKYTQLKDNK